MEYATHCGLTFERDSTCYADGVRVGFWPDEDGIKAGVKPLELSGRCQNCPHIQKGSGKYIHAGKDFYTAKFAFCQAFSNEHREHIKEELPEAFTGLYGDENGNYVLRFIFQVEDFRSVLYRPFVPGMSLLDQVSETLDDIYSKKDEDDIAYLSMYNLDQGYNQHVNFDTYSQLEDSLIEVKVLACEKGEQNDV